MAVARSAWTVEGHPDVVKETDDTDEAEDSSLRPLRFPRVLRYPVCMSDSWLDRIPSVERQRIREKLHLSEAEYASLREKVKGPEDLEREMDRNERMAEARFALESEPKAKEMLRKQITEDLKSSPPEAVLDRIPASVSKGNFDVVIEVNPQTKEDQVFVIPEGVIQEKIPVKQTFSEQYITQLLSGGQAKT